MTAKRVVDLLLATGGLIVSTPLLLLIALAIKLDSPGPVIFKQQRVGRHGRLFHIWKFRTMHWEPADAGPKITVGGDPRITRMGSFLRKTKLDELPQLFNVLKGEMSLVGPRPEVPKYVALYDEEQRKVLELVPGITDIASITYIDESEILARADDPEREYIERVMPEKIRLNLEYASGATIFTDMVILLKTVAKILSDRNGARS